MSPPKKHSPLNAVKERLSLWEGSAFSICARKFFQSAQAGSPHSSATLNHRA